MGKKREPVEDPFSRYREDYVEKHKPEKVETLTVVEVWKKERNDMKRDFIKDPMILSQRLLNYINSSSLEHHNAQDILKLIVVYSTYEEYSDSHFERIHRGKVKRNRSNKLPCCLSVIEYNNDGEHTNLVDYIIRLAHRIVGDNYDSNEYIPTVPTTSTKEFNKMTRQATCNHNYVFTVMNKETGMGYIAARGCNKPVAKDIGVTFFTSSTNTRFVDDFEKNPDNYGIAINGDFKTRKEADDLKHELHKLYNVGDNPKYYNFMTQSDSDYD